MYTGDRELGRRLSLYRLKFYYKLLEREDKTAMMIFQQDIPQDLLLTISSNTGITEKLRNKLIPGSKDDCRTIIVSRFKYSHLE